MLHLSKHPSTGSGGGLGKPSGELQKRDCDPLSGRRDVLPGDGRGKSHPHRIQMPTMLVHDGTGADVQSLPRRRVSQVTSLATQPAD